MARLTPFLPLSTGGTVERGIAVVSPLYRLAMERGGRALRGRGEAGTAHVCQRIAAVRDWYCGGVAVIAASTFRSSVTVC
jgi:hypothetical protein